jgi:N-acetylglutamate synthase-like GNAT family acetyltransferase
MPPVVRIATKGDLPRIIELLAQLAPDIADREDPSRLGMYAKVLTRTEDQGQRLVVVEDEGRIVGTLSLVLVENLSHQGAPYAILENIVVDDSARGKRYGETLVMAAVEQAREFGCYKVSLTSNKRRTDAHRFYERLGFIRTHEAFRINF